MHVGTYAEVATVKATLITAIIDGVSFEQAGALPCVALTALSVSTYCILSCLRMKAAVAMPCICVVSDCIIAASQVPYTSRTAWRQLKICDAAHVHVLKTYLWPTIWIACICVASSTLPSNSRHDFTGCFQNWHAVMAV